MWRLLLVYAKPPDGRAKWTMDIANPKPVPVYLPTKCQSLIIPTWRTSHSQDHVSHIFEPIPPE